MKKLTVIFAAIAMLCFAATSRAQSPQAVKYQAIARTSSGEVIANQSVSFRISILQGSAQGNTVYQEIQPATTNTFGLANLNIGQGSVLFGTFDSIAWGNGTYFVKVEFDPQGGTNFVVMGTSQLLSVPYSLYAQHAKLADGTPVQTAKLIATNLQIPFNEPPTGLLVYNTDSGGKVPFNVFPGYYYNAGTPQAPNWVMLNTSNSPNRIADACPGGNNAWGCSANSSTSGSNNTAYGDISYNASAIGNNNSAYGYSALNSLTSGTDNTGLGDSALLSITSGSYNSVYGAEAMGSNASITGMNNTGGGYWAHT